MRTSHGQGNIARLGHYSYVHRWWVEAQRVVWGPPRITEERLFIGPRAITRAGRWIDEDPA